jgi:hypothetical protein
MNLIENIQLIESYKNITLCLSFTVLKPLNEKKLIETISSLFLPPKQEQHSKGNS